MKKKRTRKPQRRDAFSRFADEVGRYLKSLGWTALVVGSPSIHGISESRIGNYELTVKFTGGKSAAASQGETP